MLESQQLQLSSAHPLRTSPGGFGSLSAPAVHFSRVRYPERLSEILELRRTAYLAARKIAGTASAHEMLDRHDLRAWIVAAESAGRIIGCTRLTPPLPGAVLGQPALGESVPGLPPKSDYLESARACIDPEYQGSGLSWHLAAHMLIAARRLGKPYLIAGIDASLWNFWSRCGYRKIGVSYENTVFSGIEHEVGVLDVEAALAGDTIDPKLRKVLSAVRLQASLDTGVSALTASAAA